MRKCEVGGCYRTPVEKAHIRSRGSRASAKKHNLIHLCVYHHRAGPESFHTLGVWTFAELFDFTERFKEAYRIEDELDQEKYKLKIQKAKTRQKKRRICPTCKRTWSKGVIYERRIIEC